MRITMDLTDAELDVLRDVRLEADRGQRPGEERIGMRLLLLRRMAGQIFTPELDAMRARMGRSPFVEIVPGRWVYKTVAERVLRDMPNIADLLPALEGEI